jgi:hypothetical protein
MIKLLTALSLALWALLVSAPLAYAEALRDDQVITGQDFTLRAGETITGNLVVMGGNVTIEAGARITENIVVFGGNVELAGEVGGDVVTFGGDADLLSTAVVEGNLITPGGSITRAEGAQVNGVESQGFNFDADEPLPFLPEALQPLNPFIALLRDSVLAVIIAGLAAFSGLLVTLFLPEQSRRITAAIINAPMVSGLLGLLTLFAVPILLALLAVVTLLCLSPVSALGLMVYFIAVVFGWLALGALIGDRLAAALRWHSLSPAISAAIGAFLLTLFARLFDVIANFEPAGWAFVPLQCVSAIIGLALASIGLGAVTLTRFGTRPYFGNASAAAPGTPSLAPAAVAIPTTEAAPSTTVPSEAAPPDSP